MGGALGCTRAGDQSARGCSVPKKVANTCGPLQPVFFEPEGETETQESWEFVGIGQGGYSKIQSYKDVGSGKGSYEKPPTRERCFDACRKLFCVLLLLAIVAGSILFFVQPDAKEKLDNAVEWMQDVINATTASWGGTTNETEFEEESPTEAPISIVARGARRYVCATGDQEAKVAAAIYSEWDTVDQDQDGKVTRTEIMLQKDTISAHVLDKLLLGDRNTDGVLDFEEFAAVLGRTNEFEIHEPVPRLRRLGDTPADTAGDVDTWGLDKRQWCCSHWRVGCAGLEALLAAELKKQEDFDCEASIKDWEVGWSDQKKEHCCKTKRLACNPNQLFECTLSVNGLDWSEAQQTYCCKEKGVGCTTEDAETEEQKKKEQDEKECVGDSKNWDPAAKAWCCQHKQRGCPPDIPNDDSEDGKQHQKDNKNEVEEASKGKKDGSTTPAPPQVHRHADNGCDHVCDTGGVSSTCSSRVMWSAEHSWSGVAARCTKALETVMMDCDICAQCSLAEVGCENKAPENPVVPILYDCNANYKNRDEGGWSPEKRKWCCNHMKLGCIDEVPLDEQPEFDCDAGLGSWEWGWSEVKKKYCCAHEKKGCSNDN
mmetsp:Transcript_3792/g.8521  ORF Transcript_3792/g.8521 Transcript_3792/m.8521 type:complete len:599 (+) Transcript_3792:303-2099(+)